MEQSRTQSSLVRLLMADKNPYGTIVYVYRSLDDWPDGRYLFQRYPFPELFKYIRDEYGSGEYAIIIRRGTTMIFSGITRIEAPIGWKPSR